MGVIYLDLETTGLDENSSIIEIAAEYHVNGKRVTSFSTKCFDPEAIVNLEALNVNNTKFSDLRGRKDEKTELKVFFDWVLDIVSKDSNIELSGINIQFDFNLLKARASKYKINVGGILPYRLYDIGQEARYLVRHGLLNIEKSSGRGNTLKDLCTTLDIDLGKNKLHSAEGDVALYPQVQAKLTEILYKALGK